MHMMATTFDIARSFPQGRLAGSAFVRRRRNDVEVYLGTSSSRRVQPPARDLVGSGRHTTTLVGPVDAVRDGEAARATEAASRLNLRRDLAGWLREDVDAEAPSAGECCSAACSSRAGYSGPPCR